MELAIKYDEAELRVRSAEAMVSKREIMVTVVLIFPIL